MGPCPRFATKPNPAAAPSLGRRPRQSAPEPPASIAGQRDGSRRSASKPAGSVKDRGMPPGADPSPSRGQQFERKMRARPGLRAQAKQGLVSAGEPPALEKPAAAGPAAVTGTGISPPEALESGRAPLSRATSKGSGRKACDDPAPRPRSRLAGRPAADTAGTVDPGGSRPAQTKRKKQPGMAGRKVSSRAGRRHSKSRGPLDAVSSSVPAIDTRDAAAGTSGRKLTRRRQPSKPPAEPKAPPKAKPGRPRIERKGQTLAATRPWEALGMSQRTWFRRQAEKRGK